MIHPGILKGTKRERGGGGIEKEGVWYWLALKPFLKSFFFVVYLKRCNLVKMIYLPKQQISPKVPSSPLLPVSGAIMSFYY